MEQEVFEDVEAELPTLPMPPRPCSAMRSKYKILLYRWRHVSKTLGPISRHRMAQILPMFCDAARASRHGFAVGIRVLCNSMCTSQRFHIDGEEQRCRVGCNDEPDSLTSQRMTSLQIRHHCLAESRSPPSKRPSASRPHHSLCGC